MQLVKGDLQDYDLNGLLTTEAIDTVMHFAAQVSLSLSLPLQIRRMQIGFCQFEEALYPTCIAWDSALLELKF